MGKGKDCGEPKNSGGGKKSSWLSGEEKEGGGKVENREFLVLLLVSEGQLAHCQQIFTQLGYVEARIGVAYSWSGGNHSIYPDCRCESEFEVCGGVFVSG